MTEDLLADLAAGPDAARLNTLQLYACRFGAQQHASLIQQLIANVLASNVTEAAIDNGVIATDPDTLKAMCSLEAKRGSVAGHVMSVRVWSRYLQDEGLIDTRADLYADAADSPEEAWELFIVGWETAIQEFLYLSPSVANVFTDLEKYRYHEDGTLTREDAK